MTNKKIRIVIIEDHQVVIDGLILLLKQEKDIEVCGYALNGHDGLELIQRESPDVAILDLSMEGKHGLEIIKDCKAMYPSVAILVLSMHSESIYADRVIKAGAMGYMMKSESLAKVSDGIRAVNDGDLYVSESVKKQMLNRSTRDVFDDNIQPATCLSDRELQVFNLIGQGLRPRHIVEKLNMSPKTVDSHCRNIRIKMNIKDMKSLIKTASDWMKIHEI